jgi:pimeloyl-ACP methyl ester carboxylesterase
MMNQLPPISASPTIVLVHGGFTDAAIWMGVIDRLQGDGFTMLAPANPLRGLVNDSAYVSNVVKTIQEPVLLAGHSYGGVVITNVGAQVENAVGLVYVAAMAPDEARPYSTRRRTIPGPRSSTTYDRPRSRPVRRRPT